MQTWMEFTLYDWGIGNLSTAPIQIVKGHRNSQLRKNEGTNLRKNESPRKYCTKAKNRSSIRCTSSRGGVVRNAMAGRYHVCPGGVPCNTQSKEETGEKGEAKDQVPRICPKAEH